MAAYTWNDAITFLSNHVRGMPLTDIDEVSADLINSIMWRSFPWSWSLTALTAVALVDGTQDYSFGGSDGTNIMRLTKARITRTDTTPDEYKSIDVWKWLEPNLSGKVAYPNFKLICHDRRANKLRLEGAASISSGQTLQIDGEFQKKPTKITVIATDVVFPDHYFDVAVAGLMWQMYKFANDRRAGTAAMIDGRIQYTGQLGEFHDALLSMAEAESWGQSDQIYPEVPLIEFDV